MRCIHRLILESRTRTLRGFSLLTALLVVAIIASDRPASVSADSKEATTAASRQADLATDLMLIALAKQDSEIMKNLTYLSDVIGPRLTGSANLKKANDWAAEKMKSYGLSNVHLEAWEMPMGWERGMATAKLIDPDNGRSITAAAMGWTPGTNGKITGDVVIINARNPQELKAYEGKLKNAIVLRGAPSTVRPVGDLSNPLGERPQRGGPMGDAPKGTPPGEKSAPKAENKSTPPEKKADNSKADQPKTDTPGRPAGFDRQGGDMMRFRREMADFMRKEGVAVTLMDAGKPHGLLNMTGSWGGRDRATAADPLPALFVTHDHYALLYRLATRPSPAKTRMEIEVTNKLIPGPIAVYNTVGEIRGSEKPDEFVVVGAHLDSWDLGQGTTDNGTGTCVVLETARLLAKSGIKPKRTIRFVLFTGEEQGLHGSKAYVTQHKDDMAKTSAAIVHDTGTGKITGLSLMGRESLKPLLEGEVTTLKELGVTDISGRPLNGSDHQSFEGAGVPGLVFRQDPAEYRLTHHSQSDTLDKAREPDLVQGAQVMSVLATRIANRDLMLPRDKPAGRTAPGGTTTKEEPKKGE